MVSKTVKITNEMGFHMRPANVFVTAMTKYSSDINIIANEKKINGKSIMNIMASCIKCGADIEIRCVGEDEAAALQEAVQLVESGLGDEQ